MSVCVAKCFNYYFEHVPDFRTFNHISNFLNYLYCSFVYFFMCIIKDFSESFDNLGDKNGNFFGAQKAIFSIASTVEKLERQMSFLTLARIKARLI
jgi:hypothetical protein